MSVDKLVDSTQLDSDLTSVANAIRTKGGTSAQLAFPAGFVSAVQAIPTGGGGGTPITASGQYNLSDGDSVEMSGVSALLKASKNKTLTNSWDFKTSLVDSVGSLTATLGNGATRDNNGVTISDVTQYVAIPLHFAGGKTYELDIASISKTYSGNGNGRVFMFSSNEGFIKQSGNNWNFYVGTQWNPYNGGNTKDFSGSTLRFAIEPVIAYTNGTTRNLGLVHLYVDGTLWFETVFCELDQNTASLTIGAATTSMATMVVTGFRAYDGWI